MVLFFSQQKKSFFSKNGKKLINTFLVMMAAISMLLGVLFSPIMPT
jgi:hypothetical protein